jgi:outer membrane protein TolC
MWMSVRVQKIIILLLPLLFAAPGLSRDLRLEDLIEEALKNSPEILSSLSRSQAAAYRIPQAGSLPDPMFSFGYQNEGYRTYTYGEMQGAQYIFSASQTFPFAGKRALKAETAESDSDSIKAQHEALRLNVIARVKELYFDLFLAYKSIDLVRDRKSLFLKIEDVAVGRYASGTAPQQEVLMAQAEKYMLIEKEEMFKQKLESLEAMLKSVVGRNEAFSIGRPVEPAITPFHLELKEALQRAAEYSPVIRARNLMAEAAESRKQLAEKEYYPDFTLNASVFPRRDEFQDMWSMTGTVNIPLYFKTRQNMAVKEAAATLLEVRHELDAAKLMVTATVRDNFSVLKTAEKLMDLYKNGLIPKNYQDFELSLSGYATGKVDAIVVISRLKALLDYETQYWGQRVEREKAIARLQAVIGDSESERKENKHE